MSNTRIYVGNLPYSYGDRDLQQLFQPFGEVKFARVMLDRETGKSRGFGFVEMDSPESMTKAITSLDGQRCENQNLRVNEARERPAPGSGGDGGGGGGMRRPNGPRPVGGGAPRAFGSGSGSGSSSGAGAGTGSAFGGPPGGDRSRGGREGRGREDRERKPKRSFKPRHEDDVDRDDLDDY